MFAAPCAVRGGVALLLASSALFAAEATDAAKTIVVVSSENPKLSGQLFHPKMCPNLLNDVAFVRQVRDNRQLWLYDSRTKGVSQIIPHKKEGRIEDVNMDEEGEQGIFKGYEDELEWCPVLHKGKQYFAFVSAGGVNNHDIYLGSVGSGVDGAPRWTPDGKSLIFVSARTGDGDLYFISDMAKFFDKDLKKEPRGDFERLTTSQGEEMFPVFSPNGRFLAFTMRTSGGFTFRSSKFANSR